MKQKKQKNTLTSNTVDASSVGASFVEEFEDFGWRVDAQKPIKADISGVLANLSKKPGNPIESCVVVNNNVTTYDVNSTMFPVVSTATSDNESGEFPSYPYTLVAAVFVVGGLVCCTKYLDRIGQYTAGAMSFLRVGVSDVAPTLPPIGGAVAVCDICVLSGLVRDM